jgi:hypothetical protein
MGRLGLYPDLPPIPVVPGHERNCETRNSAALRPSK